MKRCVIVLLILAMLVSLVACAEGRTDDTVPTNGPDMTEATGETEDTETTVPVETTEPDPLAAYVADARWEDISYKDENGEVVEYCYRMPKILLETYFAKNWNEALAEELNPVFDDALAAAEEKRQGKYSSVDYSVWLWEDVLTVLMTMTLTGEEYTEYRVVSFELVDNWMLDNDDVFRYVTGRETAAAMEDIIALNLGSYFDGFSGNAGEDSVLAECREQTLSPENVDLTVLYPDEDGTLMALATVYTPAGAGQIQVHIPITDFSPLEVNEPPAADATLEELVTVCRNEHLEYTDNAGNEHNATYTMPRININTPDGRESNWILKEEIGRWLDSEVDSYLSGASLSVAEIDYDAWFWEDTLTVVAWMFTYYEWDTYVVFVFDRNTGELLDNQAVADYWSLEETVWKTALSDTMEQFYLTKYDMVQDKEDEFFKDQLAVTSSEENVLDTVLYPGKDGTLMARCKIYSIAGAEYYEHLIPVELP